MNYTLENEFLTVGVSSYGGALTSIRSKDGIEYLWQGDPAYWAKQAPLLFPICGSIRDGHAMIGDHKETHMSRHGIVRTREFTCDHQSDHAITLSITADEEMKEQFPYAFKFSVTYELDGHSLRNIITVENQDGERMPFFTGGHPAFNCPIVSGDDYTDYYVEFEKEETYSIPEQLLDSGLLNMQHRSALLDHTRRLPLSFDLFKNDSLVFDALASRSVKLASDKHGHSVQVDFADFPYLVLWTTANNGPFLAIEPWLGVSTCSDESDQFEDKRNVQFAEPGEKKNYCFTITVA